MQAARSLMLSVECENRRGVMMALHGESLETKLRADLARDRVELCGGLRKGPVKPELVEEQGGGVVLR